MTRSVLVLGADGFIGSTVVRILAADGWATLIAAGRHVQENGTGREGITPLRLDARDPSALAAVLPRVDAVVNCMAGPPTAMHHADKTLFAVAAATGRPMIVHLSSMVVYGDVVGAVAETAPLTGGLGDYAAAKLASERLAADYGRAVVLRPGCVYGPGGKQWTRRIADLLRARRLGDLGIGGDGISNLVYVDDVARAVTAALRTPTAEGQAFNLAMADAPTWNTYFCRFAKALGAVPVRRLSERRLRIETRLLAPPLKILESLAHRIPDDLAAHVPPFIPPSAARLWRQEIRLLSTKAEERLGQRWISLAEGLAESAAWCARTVA